MSGKKLAIRLPLFIKPHMSDKKLNLLINMVNKANKEFIKKNNGIN